MRRLMILYMKRYFFVFAMLFVGFIAIGHTRSVVPSPVIDSLRTSFIETSVTDYSPSEEITERFLKYSDWGRANDVLLLQLYMSVHLPYEEVERLLSLVNTKGEFSDIDYSDRTRGRWQPTLHLTRLYALMKLYADPSSVWYHNKEMRKKFHKLLNLWFSIMPESDNWWHNEIGVPRKMTAILLMFGDEVTEKELKGGLTILDRSRFGMTGQNKVWLAINNLMKGLLIGDEFLVKTARDIVAEEIAVTEGIEGIKKDWAFHQHGPQIQFGNYGLTYAESVSSLFRVLDGSPYEFSDSQYGIVDSLLMGGIAWSVWKGVMDPSFCGRQVFIDAGRGKAYSTAVSAINLAALCKNDSARLRSTADLIYYPGKYPETITGARYFNTSDCGIYRTSDWYSSIRMHSERTVGFEFTNMENMNAWFSADGALLFMQDGNEYENIFARWDWRKVPGVTAYNNGTPLKTYDEPLSKENRTGHVGGVASGDVMCTTMEINRDSLHALKSVFFFKDMVVALGTSICTDDPSVVSLTTAVDQTNINGDVLSGSNWVYHNNRGYILLPPPEGDCTGVYPLHMTVSTAEQTGKWDLIDPFYKDKWDTGEVFKCYIEHDPSSRCNSYAYAFLPCRSRKEIEVFASAPEVKVLSNNDRCQAVLCGNCIGLIFHGPGSFIMPDGSMVEAEEPSIMIIRDGRILAESALAPVRAVKSMINAQNHDDMKTRSKTFQIGKELEWQPAGDGVRRQIMGYDGNLMMVKVQFEKGAVGAPHTHCHSQSTYVASGRFEVTIGDGTAVLSAGDGYYIEPDVLHGCVCLEPGELIDTFSPMREDFLKEP